MKIKFKTLLSLLISVSMICILCGWAYMLRPVLCIPVLCIHVAEPYYEEFPVYADNDQFVDGLCNVLDTYGEWYCQKDNKIYIHPSLAKDKDLMSNYTLKAFGESNIELPNSRFGLIRGLFDLPADANLNGIFEID